MSCFSPIVAFWRVSRPGHRYQDPQSARSPFQVSGCQPRSPLPATVHSHLRRLFHRRRPFHPLPLRRAVSLLQGPASLLERACVPLVVREQSAPLRGSGHTCYQRYCVAQRSSPTHTPGTRSTQVGSVRLEGQASYLLVLTVGSATCFRSSDRSFQGTRQIDVVPNL